MKGTDTIQFGRNDALAPADLLRTLETVLEIDEVSVADALDDHFGYPGAVDILFAAAGLHAQTLQAPLNAPAELSQQAETTR